MSVQSLSPVENFTSMVAERHRRDARQCVRGNIMKVGPAGEEVTEGLDSSIWGHLSPELVEMIRMRLPLSTLLRCRCVCRRWSLLHKDPGFVELYQRVSPLVTSSVLLITYDDDGRDQVFHLESLSKWSRLRLDFMPRDACVPLASSGGLLCLGSAGTGHGLWVCNPLTGSWKRLPDVQFEDVCKQGDRPLVNMLVKTRETYDVVVVGDPSLANNQSTIVKIYRSETKMWTQQVDTQRLGRHIPSTSAIKDGVLYWCTMNPDGLRSYKLREENEWDHKAVRFPPLFVVFGDAHLVVVGGRLGLVGFKIGGGALFCAGVWTLVEEGGPPRWVEVVPQTATTAPVMPRDSRLLGFVQEDDVCVANSRTLDWTHCSLSQRRAWVRGVPVPDHHRTARAQHNWCSYEPRWDVSA